MEDKAPSTASNEISDGQWTVYYLLQIFSAGLSVIGSVLIVYKIVRDKARNKYTPYDRVLLGLSTCDILSSITYAIGAHVWAFGSPATCQAIGFLLYFWGLWSIWYNCLLSYHFLLTAIYHARRKKHIVERPERWSQTPEPWLHLTGLFCPVIAIIGLSRGWYGEDSGTCWIADQGITWSIAAIPILFTYLSLIMNSIVIYAVFRRLLLRFRDPMTMVLVQEARNTMFLYVAAFAISATPALVLWVLETHFGYAYIEAKIYPVWVLNAIFQPIQGIFNLFIYIKPAYRRFRAVNQSKSIRFVLHQAFFNSNVPNLYDCLPFMYTAVLPENYMSAHTREDFSTINLPDYLNYKIDLQDFIDLEDFFGNSSSICDRSPSAASDEFSDPQWIVDAFVQPLQGIFKPAYRQFRAEVLRIYIYLPDLGSRRRKRNWSQPEGFICDSFDQAGSSDELDGHFFDAGFAQTGSSDMLDGHFFDAGFAQARSSDELDGHFFDAAGFRFGDDDDIDIPDSFDDSDQPVETFKFTPLADPSDYRAHSEDCNTDLTLDVQHSLDVSDIPRSLDHSDQSYECILNKSESQGSLDVSGNSLSFHHSDQSFENILNKLESQGCLDIDKNLYSSDGITFPYDAEVPSLLRTLHNWPFVGCRPNDVLMRQNQSLQKHFGNQRLRQLVADSFDKYFDSTTTKLQKTKISRQIVEDIKRDNGRFMIQKEEEGGLWVEVSDHKASRKVASNFRNLIKLWRRLGERYAKKQSSIRKCEGDVLWRRLGERYAKKQSSIRKCEGDVLIGRSRMLRTHPGNIRLRQLAANSVEKYYETPRPQREKISQQIVEEIKRGNGRFLVQEEEGGLWVEVSDEKAITKVNFTLLSVKICLVCTGNSRTNARVII